MTHYHVRFLLYKKIANQQSQNQLQQPQPKSQSHILTSVDEPHEPSSNLWDLDGKNVFDDKQGSNKNHPIKNPTRNFQSLKQKKLTTKKGFIHTPDVSDIQLKRVQKIANIGKFQNQSIAGRTASDAFYTLKGKLYGNTEIYDNPMESNIDINRTTLERFNDNCFKSNIKTTCNKNKLYFITKGIYKQDDSVSNIDTPSKQTQSNLGVATPSRIDKSNIGSKFVTNMSCNVKNNQFRTRGSIGKEKIEENENLKIFHNSKKAHFNRSHGHQIQHKNNKSSNGPYVKNSSVSTKRLSMPMKLNQKCQMRTIVDNHGNVTGGWKTFGKSQSNFQQAVYESYDRNVSVAGQDKDRVDIKYNADNNFIGISPIRKKSSLDVSGQKNQQYYPPELRDSIANWPSNKIKKNLLSNNSLIKNTLFSKNLKNSSRGHTSNNDKTNIYNKSQSDFRTKNNGCFLAS